MKVICGRAPRASARNTCHSCWIGWSSGYQPRGWNTASVTLGRLLKALVNDLAPVSDSLSRAHRRLLLVCAFAVGMANKQRPEIPVITGPLINQLLNRSQFPRFRVIYFYALLWGWTERSIATRARRVATSLSRASSLLGRRGSR